MKRTLLWGHDATVLEFVASRAPVERPTWRDVAAGIGIIRGDGAMIAGIVLAEYRPVFSSVELSVAAVSSHVADTRIATELGSFVFGQLAAHRLFARTEDTNWRAKRALRALGFRNEGVKAHFFGRERHASDWRLLKPEWERWCSHFEERFAKNSPSTAIPPRCRGVSNGTAAPIDMVMAP